MAVSLKKFKKLSKSTSWTDFYLNMALEMLENVAKEKATELAKDKDIIDEEGKFLFNNFWFAQSLTEEYDKVVRGGGKTLLIGSGVKVSRGNTVAMQAALVSLLGKTKYDKNGDLLRDIGPAIQAYWVGAQLEKFPPPNVPCPGALRNIRTIFGMNLFPGVWTPISVPPINNVSPWLLNFILSASVHLLTITGFISCFCAYPPPAPPAPGILPWQGYFIKPFSGNPISSLDTKDLILLSVGTVLNVSTEEKIEASDVLTKIFKGFVEGGKFQEPQIKEAIQSIISGDEPKMAAAGEQIVNNKG